MSRLASPLHSRSRQLIFVSLDLSMKATLLCFVAWSVLSALAEANSYPYEPVKVPKAEDVVLFTNALPPATGERILKTREEVLGFCAAAKTIWISILGMTSSIRTGATPQDTL